MVIVYYVLRVGYYFDESYYNSVGGFELLVLDWGEGVVGFTALILKQ